MHQPGITDLIQDSLPPQAVKGALDEYASFHAGTVETRKTNYTRMVNDYYDLVTDFYEFGWGQSFHFAPRHRGEKFDASIARHEFFLASVLGLRPGMNVLDVGCGVGGPLRAIARFSGAHIAGVNNNAYQIKRAKEHTEHAGLTGLCEYFKADFMQLPVAAGTYDAVYAIEATCHAPDKLKLFTELHRVMKPGTHFAGYEWCLTDRYDPKSADHRAIKKGIEEGDALPDIWTMPDVVDALTGAGFEMVDSRDLAPESDPETPWYLPIAGKWSIAGFRHTEAGRWLTNQAVRVMEFARLSPKGGTAVSTMLNAGATALVRGGQTGIFTPMFFFHVRKPA
ncbi:MAG: methyltransferase domain-containing protein [Myxococcales bacterium]|nr:methyltransferase domain-containing protein [Myxococcales bacterium]